MSTTPNPRLTRRSTIITAASIGAISLAGLFAVGANFGILTSTDRSTVGNVSAAGDLAPADARVVDVYVDQPGDRPTSTTGAPAGSQRFAVDTAGTVDVSISGGRARLELITTSSGWSAAAVRTSGADLGVAFTDGTRTLEFTATVGTDGTVLGDVTESTSATPTDRPRTDHESDEHDDERYEGGDSDD